MNNPYQTSKSEMNQSKEIEPHADKVKPNFGSERDRRTISRRSLMALIGGTAVSGTLILLLGTTKTNGEVKSGGVIWEQISSSTAMPPRSNHVAVFDATRERVVVFGGTMGSTVLNDLWEYSLHNNSWTAINSSGKAPEPRFGHTAIYDPKGRRMIIYSGQGVGNRFFNDVWALDLDSNAWRELTPRGDRPETRYGSILAYDRKFHSALTFGGFTSQGRFDDTWALNLETDSWQRLSPVGPKPMRRCLHTGVHVEKLGTLIIYGGQSVGPLGDIWSLDISKQEWREITPKANNPQSRIFSPGILDEELDRFIVFGGSGEGGKVFNDVWSFDLRNGTWTELKASGSPPSNRQAHSAVFLAKQRKMLILAGKDGSYLNDLWQARF